MIQKAVILLAGYGTRCLPFTKVLPKGMIPIITKPVIAYVVEEIEKSGMNEIIFVLPKHGNGKVIKQYFCRAKKMEKFLMQRKNEKAMQTLQSIKTNLKTTFLFTGKANGSGGALLTAARHLKGQDFCVLNGDDLFLGTPPLLEMMKVYEKQQSSVLGTAIVENISLYGAVETNANGQVTKLIEKPLPGQTSTRQASVGRYIFTQNFLPLLKQTKAKPNGEIWLTDAIDKQIEQDKVFACPISAQRYDSGNPLELFKTTLAFAAQDPQMKEQIENFANKKPHSNE